MKSSPSPIPDTDPLFKCSSNSIRYDNNNPIKGHKSCVCLKPYSELCSNLQYKVPLTKANPVFFVEVKSLSENSKLTIGLASPHLREDVHLGCQNITIGYHSDTGQVISNHCSRSQTKPPRYHVGDTIGIHVTDFSEEKSSVMILKNGRPVCTKYHYERNHSLFFPTIVIEHGPVELIVQWQTAVSEIPNYIYTNPHDWLVMPGFRYDKLNQMFCTRYSSDDADIQYDSRMSLCSLQAPVPLCQERSYYEVEIVESTLISPLPSLIICLVSCGAHLAAPSSALYYEVLKFTINTQVVRKGDKLGWGLHYLPPIREGGTVKQPMICCVSLNGSFQTSVCYLEPEGGYYPFIAFTAQDFKLRINMEPCRLPYQLQPIQTEEHLSILTRLLQQENEIRDVLPTMMLHTAELDTQIHTNHLTLTLDEDEVGVHTFQYLGHSLSRERPVFQVNVTRLTEDSVLCVGVAGKFKTCNRYPGRQISSLGYHSRDGKIIYDGRSQANTQGHRFTEGDQVMIELCNLPKSSTFTLVRIWKNELPIALRYVDLTGSDGVMYPTVSLVANGSTVQCDVITPNMIEQLPTYFVNDPSYWCLPANAQVITDSTEVCLTNQAVTGHCIVCPVPMSRGMHHFEVKIKSDPRDSGVVPPMIALTTASPYDPPKESNFQLDLLRFWPRNEAATLVRKGDTMGWGVIFPDDSLSDLEEQIVLCYLTINRDVILTRALIQPAGGLHATVVLPYGCDRVTLDFAALTIHSHPFTKSNVQQLYNEARDLIDQEKKAIVSGQELPYEHKRLQDFYKPLPAESEGDITPHRLGDNEQFTIHTADHVVIKSRSKTCTIL